MDIEHLDFSFGLQPIFQDVSIHISDGDHVGVVGVNGAGKSTLFHLILKDLEPDYGKIKFPYSVRLSYLPQVLKEEISNMDCTVLEYLETGRPLKKLSDDLKNVYEKASVEDEKKSLFYLKQAGQIQSMIDFYDPYHAEEELLEIADGLHILDLLDESLKNLSGGEKSKVAFAHLLYSKPDLILLDEPTNHLDVESKSYVMNYLKNYRGTILVISHDIAFLNEVTNKTLYLDKLTHKMELFNGSFEKFKRRKEEEKISKVRLLEKQEREEEKLKKIIAKYIRGNEKKANIAKDRQKKLAKLEENKVVLEKKYKETKFKMEIQDKGDFYPLNVSHITFGYSSDDLLYDDLSFQMLRGERYLIVGENGIGKSTLLKLIVGKLKPLEGKITLGKNVSIGYYAQELEQLDENKTVVEQFFDITKDLSYLRGVLGRFLFFDEDIYKKISVLSPGERSRVALAKLALEKANFLVLDEPTNHLDPETQEIIARTFLDYPGTMLVVSHNPEFVKNLNIQKMLYLPSGKVTDFEEEVVYAYHLLAENKDLIF
mgnify:FL=1